MSAYFYKKRGALYPSDEEGARGLLKMGEGECVLVTIIRPRCVSWHRKYFGICSDIGANQDPPRDKDSIDHELRVLAGHYTVTYVEGFEIRSPKRIAFDKLSADAWEALWPSLEQAIAQKYGAEYLEQRAA